jgi:hypothetical protein
LAASTSAPAEISFSTMALSPSIAAKCRAVLPRRRRGSHPRMVASSAKQQNFVALEANLVHHHLVALQ